MLGIMGTAGGIRLFTFICVHTFPPYSIGSFFCCQFLHNLTHTLRRIQHHHFLKGFPHSVIPLPVCKQFFNLIHQIPCRAIRLQNNRSGTIVFQNTGILFLVVIGHIGRRDQNTGHSTKRWDTKKWRTLTAWVINSVAGSVSVTTEKTCGCRLTIQTSFCRRIRFFRYKII